MRSRRVLSLSVFFLVLACCALTSASAAEQAVRFPEGYTHERYLKDKEKAEMGDADSQFVMGYLHHRQVVNVVAQDSRKAFDWYHKSALQGHVQAAQVLGLLYQKGEGTEADLVAAKRWHQFAADRGLVEAQYALGVLYVEGQGGAVDEELAVLWFKRADKQNFPPASIALGAMCAGGKGVPKDMELAFAWFLRSAELGHGEGMLRVAGMYRTGTGVTQDLGISIRWLEEALKVNTRASFLAANDLSWMLATCPDEGYRNSKRALELAESLVKSGGTRPSALDTLAAAYAANGLFEKAIRIQEAAIGKLDETRATHLMVPFRERLASYKEGKAWIEP